MYRHEWKLSHEIIIAYLLKDNTFLSAGEFQNEIIYVYLACAWYIKVIQQMSPEVVEYWKKTNSKDKMSFLIFMMHESFNIIWIILSLHYICILQIVKLVL